MDLIRAGSSGSGAAAAGPTGRVLVLDAIGKSFRLIALVVAWI